MMESENITQLRHLINELDKQDRMSEEYHKILDNITNIINDEQTVICGLKGNSNKIKHYESICKNILSIISSVKV